MKTKSLLGATLVDEAKAVAIIDYCLHGPLQQRRDMTQKYRVIRQKKPCRKQANPVTNTTASWPLDEVVLRKYTAPPVHIPVIHVPMPKNIWRPLANVKFPAGLCYLAAVRGSNRQAAVKALGFYPMVWALINCPLLEQSGYLLVEQAKGLYHMVTKYTIGAMTLRMARSSWKVGAHLPHQPHPGHNAGYPQRPMSLPNMRPPLPPQANVAPRYKQQYYAPHMTATSVLLGVPSRKPKPKPKQQLNKGPFHPYQREQNRRKPASPAVQWKAALTDPLDDAMERFKGELDIFPTSIAVPAWQDLLAHLALLKKEADFDRKLCIPAIAEQFHTIMDKVKLEFAVIQDNERVKEETLT